MLGWKIDVKVDEDIYLVWIGQIGYLPKAISINIWTSSSIIKIEEQLCSNREEYKNSNNS